jgi:hypothetical protein
MSEEHSGTNGRSGVDTTILAEQELSTLDDGDREVIEMATTVDVSGMDDQNREVLAHLAAMYEDSFREVVAKNVDYGFSFLHTGAKLAESEGTPFEDPARSIAYGLLTRSGDKRERLIENVYGNGSTQVSDEPPTTAKEAANYYFFLALVLAEPDLVYEMVSP